MSGSQRYARVPAETGRAGWQRGAGHTATAGSVQGRGTSQAKALDDLGSRLAQAAQRDADDAPSVWWDAANAVLWVAYPDVMHGGYRALSVAMGPDGPGRVYDGTSGVSPASQAFESAHGMKRVS